MSWLPTKRRSKNLTPSSSSQPPAKKPTSKSKGRMPPPPDQEPQNASQDTTQNQPQMFVNEHAQALFSLYSNREIIPGRVIRFRDFAEFNLERHFVRAGWNKFLEIEEPIYPELVKLFYSNLSINNGVPVSLIRGKVIRLTRAEFAALLSIPDQVYRHI